MLRHRTGTKYEDMYWNSSIDGSIIHKIIDSKEEKCIIYSDTIKRKLMSRTDVIIMHTHPNSSIPSIADLNIMYRQKYARAFVLCHNGRIFEYTAETFISEQDRGYMEAKFRMDCNSKDELSIFNEVMIKLNYNSKISIKEVL